MDFEAVKAIFSTLPVDLVAATLFATAITVLTLRFGASFAISLSLSLIVSKALFDFLPTTFILGQSLAGIKSPIIAAAIYSGLLLVVTFILYRIMSSLSDDSARPLFAIATGLAATVVVLSMWHITPLHSFWEFNAMIQAAFGDAYRLFWIILALISFAFVRS